VFFFWLVILSNACLSFAADPAVGFKGMNDKVEELMKTIPNSHCLNQVTNPANPDAHFRWTGTSLQVTNPANSDGVVVIQGTGAGFIPEVLDTSVIDEVVTVRARRKPWRRRGGAPCRHILRRERRRLPQGEMLVFSRLHREQNSSIWYWYILACCRS
jgi:cysteine synthase